MAPHSSMDKEPSKASHPNREGSSRIPNFFRMPIAERISALHQRGLLSGYDVQLLSSGNHQVKKSAGGRATISC